MLTETRTSDIAEMIAARAERGWQLYLSKRQVIRRLGDNEYLVPSSGPQQRYIVRYGKDRESCECADYSVYRGELACKHLTAVALLYASRRRVHSACEVCGAPSSERTLIGLKNDRRRDGERYCLPHHPDSLNGGAVL